MARFHLSPPWQIFSREVEELFKYDPQVHVVYDEAENHIKLYVDEAEKAVALARLLPEKKVFGNITVKISVVPANGTANVAVPADSINEYIFNVAFADNGAFAFAKTITGIFDHNLTYVVFKNRVVQYFNDDLGDIYGCCSTLYQEIAKNVLGEREGIFYCTDKEERVGVNMPLGEWP